MNALPPAPGVRLAFEEGGALARVVFDGGKGNVIDRPLLRELARALREAGMSVDDPLAYRNRRRAAGERAPEAELVFFASPSAVSAWTEAGVPHPAQRALAIGPSTLQALLSRKTLPFFDIISLPEPSSSSFAAALQHLDLRSTP